MAEREQYLAHERHFAQRVRALADDDAAVEAVGLAIWWERHSDNVPLRQQDFRPRSSTLARVVIRALADHLNGGAR